MKEFHFAEATPLMNFIEMFRSHFIGKRIRNLYVDFWPDYAGHSSTDGSIILEFDNFCIIILYRVTSDIKITVCSKEELMQDRFLAAMVESKEELAEEYYLDPYGRGAKKEDIDGCKIERVSVNRFSHPFQCNYRENQRRDGGDYFGTVRLTLNSGTTLCFCGADSIMDGYMEVWCE